MNGKKARAIRKMVGCDLSKGSEDRVSGMIEVGEKHIGQIYPDGTTGIRTEAVEHNRTTEERYLYRQLKRVYNRKEPNEELRDQLVDDLNSSKEDKHE